MRKKKLLIILISAVLAVVLAVAGTVVIVQLVNRTPADTAVVKFDVNTELETNVIQEREIKIGRRVSQPKAFIKGDNPTNLQVYGWYTTKDCKADSKWDFKNGRVSGNMTLYAKWVELYDVNYYVNGEMHSTVNVFNGDLLEETAELVKGYKYLGSFTDVEHTQQFDFTAPITKNTNVYVKRSQGIYLSDSVEENLLSSGTLTNYLTAACGSYPTGTEEGWVEEYVIESTGEKCTYVNFGFTPIIPDGFVELSLNLDISQSQIIRITYKNLGPATEMTCYFTAMLDENTYSETGAWYNANFCWPNWAGSNSHPIAIESEMSEDDEWVTVDLNLYEVYKNGYSIWGTSPYLGALRIEVGYTNFGDDDWSNEMLIKSIEGVPHEIVVDDTDEIKDKMVSATDAELQSAGSSITINNGVSFVKDHANVSQVTKNAQVFKTTKGVLFFAENEVEARKTGGESAGFTITCPENRVIDMGNLTTLNVTLQNFGYAEELIVYVYNDQGVPVKATIEIAQKMPSKNVYTVNMYGLYGMEGKFEKVEFVYKAVGVDNLILFEDVYFTEFVPYDSVGINFNDKNSYGFESNQKVEVEFKSKDKGIQFNVLESGAVVASPDKSYDATNEGYAYIALKYNLPSNSNVTKVKVELKVDGEYRTPYEFELTVKGKVATTEAVALVQSESGFVKSVRLTFEGTGTVVLNEIIYTVNETSLPFYGSYKLVYEANNDWKGVENFYEYDSKEKKSTFIKGVNQPYLSSSIYIGFSQAATYLSTPHTTKNVLITGRTVVTLIYQNRTDTDEIGLHLSFDKDDYNPGDGSGLPVMQKHALDIDSNMGDYEWSAVSVVIEGADLATYLNKYLAKVAFEFHGEQISIRAISITVEA
ncbi:MAG: InlB B-repeat-containing protein [Clostridia bacterium]|nr:InlB B-repeat-containing protein [Clostridia bacterium]